MNCRTIYRRITHHSAPAHHPAPAHHVAHPVRHVRHAWHASVVCKYVGAGALALGLGTGAGAVMNGGVPASAWPAGWVPGAYGAPGYLSGGAFDRVHRGRIVNPKGPQDVPEPSSIAVFLVGAVAAFTVRRRG